jgi:uncharacterized protein
VRQRVAMIELRTHLSIREIEESAWDALLGADGVPYLRWRFLEALEATGCVSGDVGWAPLHLTLHADGEMIGAAAAYVKGNSEGEFVFDHSFAQYAYERLNVAYYPKLIVACPFTPATGPRVLVREGSDAQEVISALGRGLPRVVSHLELSGGHVLFPRLEQAQVLEQSGLALRLGVQYHWSNQGYATFDDFLSRYNSKRRNQIKRERRELHAQGIDIVIKTGSDIDPSTVDHAYDFYRVTVAKYFWGKQYLNRQFFEELCSRQRDDVLIVLAEERASGKVLGGAFNLLGDQRMFGRYWGAREDIRFLHFNVCYYSGIEECIRRGLQVFEPGAGGEHKVARGFEPTLTYSAHCFVEPKLDRAVRDFLGREQQAIRARLAEESKVLRPLGDDPASA